MANYIYEIKKDTDLYNEINEYYLQKNNWFSDEVKSTIKDLLKIKKIDNVYCNAENLFMMHPPNILLKQFKKPVDWYGLYELKLNSTLYKEWKSLCEKFELKSIDLSKIFYKYNLYPIAMNEILYKLNDILVIKSARELNNDSLILIDGTERDLGLEGK